jgi:hypothetical protein
MALLQSASDLARKLFQDFQQKAVPTAKSAVGNFIRQDIQRAPLVQQANFIRQAVATPQVQRVVTPIVNKIASQPIIPMGAPGYSLAKQPNSPIPTIGQFAQGRVIQPLQTAFNPKLSALERAGGFVQAALAPVTVPLTVGVGAAAGGLQTARVGGNLNQNVRQSIANAGGIGGTGLGLPLVPALAVDIATGNPKQALGKIKDLNTAVKGLKGYSPRGFAIHPEDQEIIADFINTIQTQGGKKALDPRLGKDIQRLAEHYIGKSARHASNEKLAQAFDALLSSAAKARGEDVLQTSFPKMGLVGSNSISQNKLGATGTTPQAISEIGSRPPYKTATREGGNLPKSTTASGQSIANFDPQTYIKELTQKQRSAGESGPKGIVQRGRNFLSEVKAKLVDSTAPIEDALSLAEKRGKFRVRPTSDIRPQIDRVLRAKPLASQFAKDNGLEDVIKNAPDLNALDQYMIAKQARRVAEFGKETGRDSVKDEALIQSLAPQYEQLAQTVNQYSRKLLDYSVESGLIDKNLATQLVQKYPDYVPLQRVFNELERGQPQGATRAVASISRQSVVQKLEGSEREIASPIESLLLKTQTAFEQGEKNKAGRMLAGYKDLPGFQGLLRELPSGQSAPHTISYLDNGVKRTLETTPEIAAAAKNLNQEQMNVVLKILSVPTRVLQLGATGLNVPFVVTNIAKDQITAFINSNKAARTSLLNPWNFIRSLGAALSHDELYDDVVRQGGMQTSFDISRSQPNLSVAQIRAGRNIGSKALYTVTRPAELLRALENAIGRTEEATRIQQYRGTYKALIGEGRTPADARILAAKAARENTANFARKGDIGKVVNYLIPFFNAGIQGARVLVRNAQTRPLQTGTKLAVGVFMPVAATTAWNMSDPQRKAIYEDIDEYEKQNNLILIPDGAVKDEKGKYNVLKIPLPPGLSNLGAIVRRSMEQANGLDPVKFSEIANNLITAGTSIDVSSTNKIASTFTPQALKPFVEGYTNTNLFTGNKIVPDALKDLPVTEQAQPWTSGTARLIGQKTGQSPLKVENFIRTAAGGVGSQVLNTSDTVLNKLGQIPDEQVGGESVGSQLERRFRRASGGAIEEKGADEVTAIKEQSALDRYKRKQNAEKLYKELKQLPPAQAFEQYKKLKEEDPLQFKSLNTHIENEKLGLTYREKVIKDLTVEDQARAKFIAKEFKGKSREEKAQLWNDWVKKKIITKNIVRQLNAMKERGEL